MVSGAPTATRRLSSGCGGSPLSASGGTPQSSSSSPVACPTGGGGGCCVGSPASPWGDGGGAAPTGVAPVVGVACEAWQLPGGGGGGGGGGTAGGRAGGGGGAPMDEAEQLRARMVRSARAGRVNTAHLLLEQLFGVRPALVEPKLLVWAVQRRSTSSRLWWEAPQRAQSGAMLVCALGDPHFDTHAAELALELQSLLRRADEMDSAGHPITREMHSLHHNIRLYMQSARPPSSSSSSSAADGGTVSERPSGPSVPAHIKKMGKRYDFLREELQRLCRTATPFTALPAVVEETPRSALTYRSDADEPVAPAAPTAPAAPAVPSLAAPADYRGPSPESDEPIDENTIDPMIEMYLA